MKKVLMFAVLGMFVASAAFAQGIGLGWEDGISVKAMTGPVSVQGVLGFWNTSPENDNLDSATALEIAGYAAFPIIDMGDSKMNVFGGLGIGTMTDMEMDLAIRGGLQHDVMVTDYISVSGKAGLEIMMDGGIEDIDDTGSTDIGTWGTLGIYWWFN